MTVGEFPTVFYISISHKIITRFLSSPALHECVCLCYINLFLDCPHLWIFLQLVEYLQVAVKAANFIKEKMQAQKGCIIVIEMAQQMHQDFFDDYAFLINGLLDLYQFGGFLGQNPKGV
uniref:Uncharacterized protein n=1 Tax=Aegilops tauschii subsp. strangulata TaxID=200361 RepID=A0A453R7I6_AEGTS